MRIRYHGRRYRVNVFPILAVFLLSIAIIVFAVSSCMNQTDSPASPSAGAASSSALPAGGEPESGGPASGAGSDSSGSPGGAEESSEPEMLPAGNLSDWNLILLNPDEENKIDVDLDIEKTQFDEMWVDSRTASAYQAMCDAAKADGITLYLRSGYRSIATQRANFDRNVEAEMARGNNEAEAIRLTKLYYTVPGHSEHHTGLAFDIITPEYHQYVYTLDETFANDGNYNTAYYWLVEHCADYGFILRYPKDKQDITHINFEPWHYRYVGVEHARYITEHGLCLEEYIQLLRAAGR